MTNAAAADAQLAGGPGQADLGGRSAGVVVCAVMGFTWAASALGVLPVPAAVSGLAASVAITAALLVGAHRLRPSSAALPEAPSAGDDAGNVRRRFNLIVLAEVVGIAAIITVLSRMGHSEWIAASICAAVGLHFVPLARLFRVRLYDATAAALCVAGGATFALGAAGAPASVWQLVPGFGAALTLWVTGARLLATTVARTPTS